MAAFGTRLSARDRAAVWQCKFVAAIFKDSGGTVMQRQLASRLVHGLRISTKGAWVRAQREREREIARRGIEKEIETEIAIGMERERISCLYLPLRLQLYESLDDLTAEQQKESPYFFVWLHGMDRLPILVMCPKWGTCPDETHEVPCSGHGGHRPLSPADYAASIAASSNLHGSASMLNQVLLFSVIDPSMV